MRFWFRSSQGESPSTRAAIATKATGRACDPCPNPCSGPCALSSLPAGVRAVIITVGCPFSEASRLRALGVFEGARVGIVERCGGLHIEVHGSRLAIDAIVAASILVEPLPA
ncbi:MAG TPA: FeoA family protein [Gemmatimonadaceae bacterium]|nr:FeoA family protein [Gemmatimonadaceae bacterium]